jgi:hypothetical protein
MFETFFLFDSFWGLYFIACHFCKFFAFLFTPKAPHPTFRPIIYNIFSADINYIEFTFNISLINEVCEYSPWKKYHKPGNKSYGIVLGTVIKKLKVKISTFLNKTKFDIVILKFIKTILLLMATILLVAEFSA